MYDELACKLREARAQLKVIKEKNRLLEARLPASNGFREKSSAQHAEYIIDKTVILTFKAKISAPEPLKRNHELVT